LRPRWKPTPGIQIDIERLAEWTHREQRAGRVIEQGVGLEYAGAVAGGIETRQTSVTARCIE